MLSCSCLPKSKSILANTKTEGKATNHHKILFFFLLLVGTLLVSSITQIQKVNAVLISDNELIDSLQYTEYYNNLIYAHVSSGGVCYLDSTGMQGVGGWNETVSTNMTNDFLFDATAFNGSSNVYSWESFYSIEILTQRSDNYFSIVENFSNTQHFGIGILNYFGNPTIHFIYGTNSIIRSGFSMSLGVAYGIRFYAMLNNTNNQFEEKFFIYTADLGTGQINNVTAIYSENLTLTGETTTDYANGTLIQEVGKYNFGWNVIMWRPLVYSIKGFIIYPLIKFIYTISPSVRTGSINWLISHVLQYYEIQKGTAPLISCTLTINGIIEANGTYSVRRTSIATDINSITSNPIQTLNSSFVNGKFSFTLSTRTSSVAVIYEIINIVVNVPTEPNVDSRVLPIGASSGYIVIVWTNQANTGQGQPLGNDSFTNFILMFILIFVPVLLFGLLFKEVGIIIALALVIGIGAYTQIVPYWLVFLIGIAEVILVFTKVTNRI